MSLDKLIASDDPRLKTVCEPVEPNDSSIASELESLQSALAEFRSLHGFGRAIAAPQLGILKRMIAVNINDQPFEILNPEITWRSDDRQLVWDDCLSLPDILVQVSRHNSISLTYIDRTGKKHVWEKLPSDLAELMQHEIDHLDGILMTDRAVSDSSIRPISERASLLNAD